MRRWVSLTGLAALAGSLALIAITATAAAPVVNHAVMKDLEIRFDRQIETFDINDPFYLLGNTRGIYLADYGAVFTAELNLVGAANVTPFRPEFTDEQKEQLRQKKIGRLAVLKTMMRDMMVDSATTLDAVPPNEQIVVGTSLFYYSWEDRTGLPSQVLMQAQRQAMLDFESGRITGPQLDAAIRVTEY